VRNARLLALTLAIVVLGSANVMAWRGRTVTTITEVSSPGAADRASTAAPSGDQLVARGRSLFRAKGCAACHIDVQSGPSLTNLKQRAGKTKDDLSAEEYVRESIVAPSAYKANGGSFSGEMPTLPVNATELDALVAYLLTL
jgi:mono/diheme cytochrome c family protein